MRMVKPLFNRWRKSLNTFDHVLDGVWKWWWSCDSGHDHLVLVQKESLVGWVDTNWERVVDGGLVKDQSLFVVDDMDGMALVARETHQNCGKTAYVGKSREYFFFMIRYGPLYKEEYGQEVVLHKPIKSRISPPTVKMRMERYAAACVDVVNCEASER